MFNTGASSYCEYDELDLLLALSSGELVIVSRFKDGELRNRSLCHRLEPLELRCMEPGEELRVLCLGRTDPLPV